MASAPCQGFWTSGTTGGCQVVDLVTWWMAKSARCCDEPVHNSSHSTRRRQEYEQLPFNAVSVKCSHRQWRFLLSSKGCPDVGLAQHDVHFQPSAIGHAEVCCCWASAILPLPAILIDGTVCRVIFGARVGSTTATRGSLALRLAPSTAGPSVCLASVWRLSGVCLASVCLHTERASVQRVQAQPSLFLTFLTNPTPAHGRAGAKIRFTHLVMSFWPCPRISTRLYIIRCRNCFHTAFSESISFFSPLRCLALPRSAAFFSCIRPSNSGSGHKQST